MAEEQEVDFSKLSIEERCQHKNWKARVSAYEELTTIFQTQSDDKEFNKYGGLVKKFVIDSNAASQEKGLAAVLAFVENYSQAGKSVEGIVSGIIAKCLTSPKVKTKELAQDIVLMFVEIEKQEVVIDELIKGLDNKTPKIVVACATLMKQCIRDFGVRIINIKPIVKVIPKLLEDRDKNVREEGKLLAVEIYRWIKAAIKPQIQNLKPIQLQELEAAFEKEKDDKPSPTRFIRSEQTRAAQIAGDEQIEGQPDDNNVEEIVVDSFDLLDPVDILSKLPKDFYELCEAKKWQERKEALDTLLKLIEESPKLQTGDYSELIKQLKKMIGKDTNVVVVAAAAKCLAGIAKGLRNSFAPYANSCIQLIFEKFKEKKANVVQGLREAIDAIIVSTSLEAIIEDFVSALDNKNPQIKSETALFLVRTIAKSHPSVISNKKLLKPLCDSLVKTLNDMDSSVRDASAEAIGTTMKVVGEKTITPFIQGVDAIKMTKIKEFYDKAEVKVVFVPPKAPPPKAAAPKVVKKAVVTVPKAPSASSISSSRSDLTEDSEPQKKIPTKKSLPSKPVIKKPVQSKIQTKTENGDVNTGNAGTKTMVRGRMSIQPTVTKPKKEEVSNTPLIPLNNKLKDQRLADEKALKVLKWNFTSPREEFYQQLKEQMITAEWQTNLINYCFHYDFKFHIKAIDSLRDYLKDGNFEATVSNCDLILKWLALRFFDTNPSVILKALEYLIILFEAYQQNNVTLTEAEANSFIPYLILKSGDPKDAVRNKVHEIISKLRDVYSPTKLFAFLMTGLQSKNARQRSVCLDELANLIEVCGMVVCQPTPSLIIKEIAKFIADRDNGVRNAALNCVVQVYLLEGEKVYKLIGNLNDKELSLLEERIKRTSKSRIIPVPPQTAPASIPSSRKSASSNGTLQKNLQKTPTTITKQRPKSMGMMEVNDYDDVKRSASKRVSLVNRAEACAIPDDFNFDDEIQVEDMDMDISIPSYKHTSTPRYSSHPRESMSNMINSSHKIDVAINLVMAQLSSHDINSSLEAFSQLSVLLEEENANQILESKVDQIIIMCYMQYKLFITKHLVDEQLAKSDAVKLFKGVTNILTLLFRNTFLSKKASRDVLRELISQIISLLADGKLINLEESANIIRSLNNLASLILISSDSTNITCALIKLLHDCTGGSYNSSPKFIDLVMKCLWKIIRNFDPFINGYDIDKVFFEVDIFMNAYKSEWFKENHRDDIPLRTMKTLTFMIVHHIGENVFNHLTLIKHKHQSQLIRFLEKALKEQKEKDKNPKKSALDLLKNEQIEKEKRKEIKINLPQLSAAQNIKPIDVIEWYKQVADQLGIDASKYQDSEAVLQTLKCESLTEEEAKLKVQRAQETLDKLLSIKNFKNC